ncbi:glycosyltransferase family 2 protein [Schleiferia thermophila]|jgi:glycosyltransferase involved in cell wall biosynthesis|uniref:glycosyltransferase family 2 protein n=1 Tax=Schleiferia thermophila TaxID=884107 RepID=UPI0004E66FA4|nr:glycosyltransferase [Schleiferia thermophila]KFD38467.1 glycosyltransferase [Schleiferia thermophila str. Yellowstone]
MDHSRPVVSVIVPNYNHATYLSERLNSIASQTYDHMEIILLDDASTDGSVKILKRWAADKPHVRLFVNEKNSGTPFAQWNKGIALATGKYVWIAESDDVAAPEMLATLVDLLEQQPEACLAFCQSVLIDKDGRLLHSFNEHYTYVFKTDRWERDFCADAREECYKYMLLHNTIPNASAVVFRREALAGLLPLDESFKLNGDWFFYVRLLSCSEKFCYTAKAMNFFRYHPQTQRRAARNKTHAFFEILQIQDYIRSRFPQAEESFVHARRMCATWWIGNINGSALFNVKLLKSHYKLYQAFKPYFRHLWWRIVWHFVFITVRRPILWLGLKRPLKRLRSRLYPGKYFDVELPD